MKKLYECEYCHKRFKRESNYLKHECEKMRRHQHAKTSHGRRAFNLYREWMKIKHRLPPSKETYINSRYYNAFDKLVTFSTQMAIPIIYDYIKFMCHLGIEPHHWTSFEVYQRYIDSFDTLYTPLEQVKISVDTLLQLSRIFQCETRDVMKQLDVDDVIKLIQAKKLSPWLLLFSQSFQHYIRARANKREKILIETIMNPTSWKRKIQNKQSYVGKIKRIIKELNI